MLVTNEGDPKCCGYAMKRSEYKSGRPWWCAKCGAYMDHDHMLRIREAHSRAQLALGDASEHG